MNPRGRTTERTPGRRQTALISSEASQAVRALRAANNLKKKNIEKNAASAITEEAGDGGEGGAGNLTSRSRSSRLLLASRRTFSNRGTRSSMTSSSRSSMTLNALKKGGIGGGGGGGGDKSAESEKDTEEGGGAGSKAVVGYDHIEHLRKKVLKARQPAAQLADVAAAMALKVDPDKSYKGIFKEYKGDLFGQKSSEKNGGLLYLSRFATNETDRGLTKLLGSGIPGGTNTAPSPEKQEREEEEEAGEGELHKGMSLINRKGRPNPATVLAILASQDATTERISESGGIQALIKLAASKDLTIRTNVAVAFYSFSLNSSTCLKILQDSSAIQSLLSLLRSPPSNRKIRYCCTSAFYNMSKVFGYEGVLLRENVLRPILSTVPKEDIGTATAFLHNLTCGGSSSFELEELLAAALELLSRLGPGITLEVRLMILKTICNLSRFRQFSNRLLKDGTFATLLQVFEAASAEQAQMSSGGTSLKRMTLEETREVVLEIFQVLSKSPQCQRPMAEQRIDRLMAEAAKSSNPRILTLVAGILQNLTEDSSSCSLLLAGGFALPLLSVFFSSPVVPPEARRATVTALQRLATKCHKDTEHQRLTGETVIPLLSSYISRVLREEGEKDLQTFIGCISALCAVLTKLKVGVLPDLEFDAARLLVQTMSSDWQTAETLELCAAGLCNALSLSRFSTRQLLELDLLSPVIHLIRGQILPCFSFTSSTSSSNLQETSSSLKSPSGFLVPPSFLLLLRLSKILRQCCYFPELHDAILEKKTLPLLFRLIGAGEGEAVEGEPSRPSSSPSTSGSTPSSSSSQGRGRRNAEVEAMTRKIDDPVSQLRFEWIQLHSLSSLLYLFQEDESRISKEEERRALLQALVRLAKEQPKQTASRKIFIAGILCRLCRTASPAALLEEGVDQTLVFLSSAASDDIASALLQFTAIGLSFLAARCCHEQGNKGKPITHELLPAVVKAASSNDESLRRSCAIALCRLAEIPGNEEKILAMGAGAALLMMALIGSTSEYTQKLCVLSLFNLLGTESLQLKLVKDGVLWALSKYAKAEDEELRKICAVSFCNLALNPRTRGEVTTISVLAALRGLLLMKEVVKDKETSERETEKICLQTVCNLLANPEHGELIVREGFIPAIKISCSLSAAAEASPLRSLPSLISSDIPNLCSQILSSLVLLGTPQLRDILVQREDILPLLCSLAVKGPESVRDRCLYALLKVSNEPKFLQRLLRCGIVDGVLRVLKRRQEEEKKKIGDERRVKAPGVQKFERVDEQEDTESENEYEERDSDQEREDNSHEAKKEEDELVLYAATRIFYHLSCFTQDLLPILQSSPVMEALDLIISFVSSSSAGCSSRPASNGTLLLLSATLSNLSCHATCLPLLVDQRLVSSLLVLLEEKERRVGTYNDKERSHSSLSELVQECAVAVCRAALGRVNTHRIVRDGGGQILHKASGRRLAVPGGMVLLTASIKKLVTPPGNHEQLVDDKIVETILSVLATLQSCAISSSSVRREEEEEAIRNCAESLQKLSCNPRARLRLGLESSLNAIINLAEAEDKVTRTCCLGILANLSKNQLIHMEAINQSLVNAIMACGEGEEEDEKPNTEWPLDSTAALLEASQAAKAGSPAVLESGRWGSLLSKSSTVEGKGGNPDDGGPFAYLQQSLEGALFPASSNGPSTSSTASSTSPTNSFPRCYRPKLNLSFLPKAAAEERHPRHLELSSTVPALVPWWKVNTEEVTEKSGAGILISRLPPEALAIEESSHWTVAAEDSEDQHSSSSPANNKKQQRTVESANGSSAPSPSSALNKLGDRDDSALLENVARYGKLAPPETINGEVVRDREEPGQGEDEEEGVGIPITFRVPGAGPESENDEEDRTARKDEQNGLKSSISTPPSVPATGLTNQAIKKELSGASPTSKGGSDVKRSKEEDGLTGRSSSTEDGEEVSSLTKPQTPPSPPIPNGWSAGGRIAQLLTTAVSVQKAAEASNSNLLQPVPSASPFATSTVSTGGELESKVPEGSVRPSLGLELSSLHKLDLAQTDGAGRESQLIEGSQHSPLHGGGNPGEGKRSSTLTRRPTLQRPSSLSPMNGGKRKGESAVLDRRLSSLILKTEEIMQSDSSEHVIGKGKVLLAKMRQQSHAILRPILYLRSASSSVSSPASSPSMKAQLSPIAPVRGAASALGGLPEQGGSVGGGGESGRRPTGKLQRQPTRGLAVTDLSSGLRKKSSMASPLNSLSQLSEEGA